MNRFIFLPFALVILLATAYSTHAQNARPSVTNVRATVSPDGQQLTVEYDLTDPDDAQLEVMLQLSNARGRGVTLSGTGLAGDVGFPVAPGTGRRITWTYNAAEVAVLDDGGLRARIVADDRQPVDIQAIVNGIDQSRLRDDLTSLVGIRNFATTPSRLDAVREMLVTHFGAHRLSGGRQAFVYSGYDAGNVIGSVVGVTHPDSVIILGAHFDTVDDAPGADDNGSGTVGVMEAIRALSGLHFTKTVRFIGFDLEEEGLVGSEEYVSKGIGAGEKIGGMLDFEMIGYSSD